MSFTKYNLEQSLLLNDKIYDNIATSSFDCEKEWYVSLVRAYHKQGKWADVMIECVEIEDNNYFPLFWNNKTVRHSSEIMDLIDYDRGYDTKYTNIF